MFPMDDKVLGAEAEVLAATPKEGGAKLQKPAKRKRKRKKGPIIAAILIVLALGALVWWLLDRQPAEEEKQVLTDVVAYGSITSTIEGMGVTKAKDSEAVTVEVGGTVQEVYVSEGDYVEAGSRLFKIDSPAARETISEIEKKLSDMNTSMKTLRAATASSTVKAAFAGKLVDVTYVGKGQEVSEGATLARLVDDTQMKLTLYYSYDYEGSIYVGQTATVSVSSLYQTLSATVTEVKMVERISSDGARLFRVTLTMSNPGTLTEGHSASAQINSSTAGVMYPYEEGVLEYYQEAAVIAPKGGEVSSTKLDNYLKVSAGETLMQVKGINNREEIAALQKNIEATQKELDEAKKVLDNLEGLAPTSGTIMGLSLSAGEEVAANTVVVNIINANAIVVEAQIDERNIGDVTVGTMVEIDQYSNITTGVVESVSLEGKVENGMATFPATILVDNADGMLMSGMSVVFRITASVSDDCLVLPVQSVKAVADPETGESIHVVFVAAGERPEGAIDVDGEGLGVPAEGFYAVPVEIGISDSYSVELLSGVEEGTEVFTQVMREDMMYWG